MRIVTAETELDVVESSGGVAWPGQALRSILARELKQRTCIQPETERWTRWMRCAGCPHIHECPYGLAFDPDPPPGVRQWAGHSDAATPLVLAPYWPRQTPTIAGGRLAIRLTTLGPAANRVRELLATLRHALTHHRVFADREWVALAANDPIDITEAELRGDDLPPAPDAISGRLPRVGVRLTGPLLLRERSIEKGRPHPVRAGRRIKARGPAKAGTRRRPNLSPRFGDLFAAALQRVTDLFRLYDRPIEGDFKALIDAADRVRSVAESPADELYKPFSQSRSSTRSSRFTMAGVTGGAAFLNVPMSLLPWLIWGGRLHVGQHRIDGAGGWQVIID